MTAPIELGLDTFGDITMAADGKPQSVDQVIRELIEEAALADQIGVDRFIMRYSAGPLSHHKMMRSFGPCGSKIMPLFRDMVS